MAIQEYKKGSGVQLSAHFNSNEFDCHGVGCCSKTYIDEKLVEWLENIRFQFGGKSITINSGYRCPIHNASPSVQGASNSKHLEGMAADIVVSGVHPWDVSCCAYSLGIQGIGYYPPDDRRAKNFTHIDTRTQTYFWKGSNEASVQYKTVNIKPFNPSTTEVTLSGNTNEEKIWSYLTNVMGMTKAGAAGMMGNIKAESECRPENLQQSYEGKLGHTDASYTAALNNGTYTKQKFMYDGNGVNSGAGYGLCQWTWWTRKANFYDFVKSKGTSFDNLLTQLEFINEELPVYSDEKVKPGEIYNLLKTTNSINEATKMVFDHYEGPRDSSLGTRQTYAQQFYDKFKDADIAPPTTTGDEFTAFENSIQHQHGTVDSERLPGREIKYIVMHYTTSASSKPGQAANEASWFATPNKKDEDGDPYVGAADFAVDDATIVQYNGEIPDRFTYHCGTKETREIRSQNSIGVEMCSSNTTGTRSPAPYSESWYFTEEVVNLSAKLVKYLMIKYNINDVDCIKTHYDATGKYCPCVIGWNEGSGDTSKLEDFKSRVRQVQFDGGSTDGIDDSTDGLDDPVPTPPAFQEYVVRVTLPNNNSLDCYIEPKESSNIVKRFFPNSLLVILEKNDAGWGRIREGWIRLKDVTRVSTSEAIIEQLRDGLGEFKYDPTTGKIVYPIEYWIDDFDGGLKYRVHDQGLAALLDARFKEVNTATASGKLGVLSNLEFVKSIIIALEDKFDTKTQCEEKLRLCLKSAATSKNTILVTSPELVVKYVPNASNIVSEEEVLQTLNGNSVSSRKKIIEYLKETYRDNGWNKIVKDSPETLNFWFDFMSTEGEMGKYSVKAIGSRSKAVNDSKVTAIYFEETPSVLFLTDEDFLDLQTNKENYSDMTGYTFIKLQPFMENYFTISGQGKSAKDELDSLLYQHTYATETTNLTAVPIYHLQPNTRIFIRDDYTGINGEYIVNKITIPLQYNGTSAITTTKAVNRIY